MLTPRLFRVFPWIETARRGEPGHPLYVSPLQGAGRLDNPEHYRVLYASDSEAGAVGEAFGNHSVWTRHLLAGPPSLPGSRRGLATIAAGSSRILDLDDARRLVERSLRPSAIVTRDRAVTQRWALFAFREKRWAGIRCWSAWDSRWGAHGLWELRGVRVVEVIPLTAEHPALVEAAAMLARPVEN